MKIINEEFLKDAPQGIIKIIKSNVNKLIRDGYDPQKITFKLMHMPESSRDKIFKTPGIIPCFYLNFHPHISNAAHGWFIKNWSGTHHEIVNRRYIDINNMSIDRLLSYSSSFGIIDLRDAKTDAILDLRAKRKAMRDPNDRDIKNSQRYAKVLYYYDDDGNYTFEPVMKLKLNQPPSGYDKSGYKIPKDKYRQLADTVTPDSIIHKLTIWYVKLNKLQDRINNIAIKLRIDKGKNNRSSSNNFSSISSIFSRFSYAVSSYNDLERSVDRYLESPHVSEVQFDHISYDFISTSKDIRNYIKYIDEELNNLEENI